jgi:hypothetical protein
VRTLVEPREWLALLLIRFVNPGEPVAEKRRLIAQD